MSMPRKARSAPWSATMKTRIRAHALGKFRDLLAATVIHPAMLQYLDNAQNAVGHINENYAREIMELHTLGVGSGYSQQDVQELARILTGVGVNLTGKPPGGRPMRGDYPRQGPDSVQSQPPRLWRQDISWAPPSTAAASRKWPRRSPSWRANRPPRITSRASWRSISAATRRSDRAGRCHGGDLERRPTAISPHVLAHPVRLAASSTPRWARSSRTRCIMPCRRCAPAYGEQLDHQYPAAC